LPDDIAETLPKTIYRREKDGLVSLTDQPFITSGREMSALPVKDVSAV